MCPASTEKISTSEGLSVLPPYTLYTFALKRIEAVVGKQQFAKLIVDGICPFDEFEKTMIQYKSEVKTLYAYMNMVANLRVPIIDGTVAA